MCSGCSPGGGEFTERDWHDPQQDALGVLLDGQAIRELTAHGERIVGDTLLIWLNASATDLLCQFPRRLDGHAWEELLNTEDPDRFGVLVPGGAILRIGSRSAAIFRLT